MGVATCWGLIGGMGEHLKAYFLDLEARPVGDRWMYVVFDGPLIVALLYMFVRFLLETNAMRLLKLAIAILNVVLFVVLFVTGESVQDVYWHIQHSILHLCTAMETGLVASYLDIERNNIAKKAI